MDEYQFWYEIWGNVNPYFYEDDDSPYRYKDLEEVERAIQSVDRHPKLSTLTGKDLRVIKVFTIRVEVTI